MTEKERVILVGVETWHNEAYFETSLEELKNLTDTANGEVVGVLTQKRSQVEGKSLIGQGKLEELKLLVDSEEADLVIFNHELTPRQGQFLSQHLEVRVIDRVQLILDIFALRARSKEGKLQVELAQLAYLLPRLIGQGTALSRLGGGIGTRGPGETKLETDRRHIRDKMNQIKKEVKKVGEQRKFGRQKRKNSSVFQIGLVGYTNAGKSSLLNLLTPSETYEKDQLFATLDPLTKRWPFPNGFEVTLTDTVGFIQDLPTQLIDAFQSTLEEIGEVDLIFHVVDASDTNYYLHEETVLDLLKELHLDQIPRLTIYNKMDLAVANFEGSLYPAVKMSAKNPADKEKLVKAVKRQMYEIMKPYELFISPENGGDLARLKRETLILQEIFDEEKNAYFIQGFAKKDAFIFEGEKDE